MQQEESKKSGFKRGAERLAPASFRKKMALWLYMQDLHVNTEKHNS